MMTKAEDLKPGDLIDLEPYWTEDYDSELYFWATCEYGRVQMSQPFDDGMTIVWLEDGPSNVLAPSVQLFDVVGNEAVDDED